MSMSEKYVGPALVVVAAVVTFAMLRRQWTSRRPPYPPGPKGYPLIGNVFDFPKNPIWEGFARMAKEHGEQRALSRPTLAPSGCLNWRITETDILHLDMMGSHLVLLSNSDVATDLLERRSVIYGDRVRKLQCPSLLQRLPAPIPLASAAYGERTVCTVVFFHNHTDNRRQDGV